MEDMEADILTSYGGPGAFLTPITREGREWVDENVEYESWQLRGGSIILEGNLLEAIAEGARADGLLVD